MLTSAVWLINLSTTHNIPVSNTDYLLVRFNKVVNYKKLNQQAFAQTLAFS